MTGKREDSMLVLYVGSASVEVLSSSVAYAVVVQVALPEISSGLQFMVQLRLSIRFLVLTYFAAQ